VASSLLGSGLLQRRLRWSAGQQQDEHEERLASIRARIDRSMNDPKPSIPAEEVFDGIKKMHEKNLNVAAQT
jgi:hypothetical protein